jgi:feruloyl-CoA synthase
MPGEAPTASARAIILDAPPSVDHNEITDKGYLNQRAVLAARAALVEMLYADPPDGSVILGEE